MGRPPRRFVALLIETSWNLRAERAALPRPPLQPTLESLCGAFVNRDDAGRANKRPPGTPDGQVAITMDKRN
jgi:hypothetical protein